VGDHEIPVADEQRRAAAIVAPTGNAERPQLRTNALGLVDCIGQSVANIAPTLTPALNIAVVAGLAGSGSWLGFLIATVAILFVALNIATLSRRHTLSGSYFIYIGRTVGPVAGLIAGWLMIGAYLATTVAISVSEVLFLENLLASLGLKAFMPNAYVAVLGFIAVAAIAAYRDVRLSARFGLVLEIASVLILIVITAIVVAQRGTVIDSRQLDFTSLGYGGIMSSLTFAVFSFVGFESSATLARETRNPARNVPLAVTLSAMMAGLFFVAITYFMVLGIGDDTRALGESSAPFIVMTERAGLRAAGTAMYFGALISGLACLLASMNAASRLLFSMARYGYLASALTMVHRRYRTPSVAVVLTVTVTLIGSLAALPLGPLEAFGFLGTLATFGFLIVYFLICLAAPLDQFRAGTLTLWHLLVSGGGTLLMTFVIFGSVYPVPAWPQSLLPYIFLAYLAAGAVWSFSVARRSPQLLSAISSDKED
jgi:amino acid transporter